LAKAETLPVGRIGLSPGIGGGLGVEVGGGARNEGGDGGGTVQGRGGGGEEVGKIGAGQGQVPIASLPLIKTIDPTKIEKNELQVRGGEG